MKIKIKRCITNPDYFKADKREIEKLCLLLGDKHKICRLFKECLKVLEKESYDIHIITLDKQEIDEFTKLYKNRNRK